VVNHIVIPPASVCYAQHTVILPKSEGLSRYIIDDKG